jgi:hypothetical protein
MKRILILFAAGVLASQAFAQTKPVAERKLTPRELAFDQLEAAKRGVQAAQDTWNNILHLYGEGARKTRESYEAHINVAMAKADLCRAQNEAKVARCKTTEGSTDHRTSVDIHYFYSDGTSRSIHYYFAENADGTYTDTETEFKDSH